MRPHIFRQHRRDLGLTQDEFADALGLSKRQVGRYEAGRAPIPPRTVLAVEALVAKSVEKAA
jgi:transcriptional regulator with XRE-family HTH domain